MNRRPKSLVPSRFSDLPKSYAALCAILMPRTIHDEIELENVTDIIDRSTASRLLRGERGLSASHIRNTAKALHIAPELLI